MPFLSRWALTSQSTSSLLRRALSFYATLTRPRAPVDQGSVVPGELMVAMQLHHSHRDLAGEGIRASDGSVADASERP